MKIHVWVPEYAFSTGGIQTFSRFVVRALQDCLPTAQVLVFSKNDTSAPDVADNNKAAPFATVGSWPLPLRTLAFTLKLFHRAYRDRPQLIITTHANFAPAAYWLRRFFRIPFIAIGHGVEVWDIPSRQIRTALRNTDQLVAVSRYTRERMAKALTVEAAAIQILPDTFDSENFQPGPKPRYLLKRYRLRANQPVILTIARLVSAERYKGYDQVLRALPAVREHFPDIRYILGGHGPDRARVTKLIGELNLKENVTLAGYVPEHDLCAHYNLCDVFAMPSKGEGFGIVFLEALACGKAVIAGNKDGSADALLDGELGALIDPDNVSEISQTLIQVLRREFPLKILDDPEALREKAIETYGYSRFARRLQEIVQPFISKSTGAAVGRYR